MMKFELSYIFIFIIVGVIYVSNTMAASKNQRSNPDLSVAFVSVVFRHGDRAPDNNGDELFPTDPYRKYNFEPEGYGGLTNEGKRRAYELGSMLRREYNSFLGDTYHPYNVMSLSTDWDRTKMSLALVLAALYSPKDKQIWNRQLNWQPAVVSWFPARNDNLLASDECLTYLEELARVEKLPEVQAQIMPFYPLMKMLTNETGKNITTSRDMFNLYHSLMAEYSMGLKLSPWVYTVFPEGKLLNGTVLAYNISSYNTRLRRQFGGTLLRNITGTFNRIASNRTIDKRKINLFSGHETNVAAFLQTLGVFKPHVPQYGSAVIVELLRDKSTDAHYVKVRYYLGIPSKMENMHIPGCNEICPLETFTNLLADVIANDDDMNCPH